MLLGFEWFLYKLDLIFTTIRLIEGQCRVFLYVVCIVHFVGSR